MKTNKEIIKEEIIDKVGFVFDKDGFIILDEVAEFILQALEQKEREVREELVGEIIVQVNASNNQSKEKNI